MSIIFSATSGRVSVIRHWIVQVLIAIDQLANALFGGWADETLSAHAHRAGWTLRRHAINALFWWQKDHCEAAWVAEIRRRHLPPAYRDKQRSDR